MRFQSTFAYVMDAMLIGPSCPSTDMSISTTITQGFRLPVEEQERLRYLVHSSIHPDTGELIFLPFRMASFVPTNLLITAGLLIPNPSTTVGVHFLAIERISLFIV